MGGPRPGTVSRALTCTVSILGVTLGQVLAKRSGCSEGWTAGCAVSAHHPPWRPHPTQALGASKGGLRGHPQQALPSHLRMPRAGRSQFGDPWVSVHLGQTWAQVCFPSSPCHPVYVRVVRSCSSPTAASGKGTARRWGRGAGCDHAAGAGAPLAPAVGPPHSPHFGRHRGHGLAPQRPPPGGDGAHGRGGGASPGLRARPAPVASVGGAAPRRRSGSGSGSGLGSGSVSAWPRRSLRALRRTEQHCQARGWRSAHRDVREGAGLGGAAPVTSGLGPGRPQPKQGEEGSAHRNVRAGRGPEGTTLKPRPPHRQ